MKIESIIRRQTGSTVKMGDRVYRFVAGTDGRHVCEVEDEAHIDRLLSIREGFRAVDGAQEPAQDQDDKPKGSAQDQDDKPKAKPRKPKGSAQDQDDKPKGSAQDQDDKPKAKPRKPKGSAQDQDDKPKGSAQDQDDKPAANDQA